MNRADKTKQYLLQQLEIFKGFKSLESNKDEFFDSIIKFKDATIIFLKKTHLIDTQDLNELEKILSGLETHRPKGTGTMVYWGNLTKGFTETQSKLSQLALKMDNLNLPLRLRLFDFAKNIIAHPIIAGIIATIIAGVVLLLTCNPKNSP